MTRFKNQIGSVRWGLVLIIAILAALPASYAVARARVGYGMTGMSGLDIQQSSAYDNAFIVRDTGGTAKVTITNAGVTTWGAAQTFSGAVTFDSTTTWGVAGTQNFDGTTIDWDPTDTVDIEMAAAKVMGIDLSDNLTAALAITEAAVPYIVINTNTGSESIVMGGTADDPDFTFVGTGALSSDGSVDHDLSGTYDAEMAAAQTYSIDISDNLASAFLITEASVPYIDIDTQTGSEQITFGGTGDDPVYLFAGTSRVEIDGELELDGALDADSTADIAGQLTCSAGTGTALSVSSGGELNNDGTLDQNGNADLAGDAVFSGTSKTISFASVLDINAGADVGGAALNLSFAGDALTMGATNDASMDGYVAHGTGTPDKVVAGTAAAVYITDALEVDSFAYFDANTIVDGDFQVSTGTVTVDNGTELGGVFKWDNVAAKTAAYAPAAATTDGILIVTGAAGGWTYAYPEEDCDATADIGRIITVKCGASGVTGCSARPVAITPETATVDGQATHTLNVDWTSVDLLCGAINTLYVL